jgi:predicted metalloenzyme YecM
MTKKELIKKLQTYSDSFSKFCKLKKIDTKGIKLDHICYKCESKKEYEQLRSFFEFEDTFVYQSIISKRRISIIGFKKPIKSIFGDIKYLELSDQKQDKSQKSKVDHIEPIPDGITYKQLVKRFSLPELVVEKNDSPHHPTYNVNLPNGVKLKLSYGVLIDMIYKKEMK